MVGNLTLLALDTSTECCSVALLHNNKVYSKKIIETRSHTKVILPFIDSLIALTGISLNEIDAIAFGCGPGSFTGVRIASSITQGLGFALNKPIISVSSLQAIAQLALKRKGFDLILSSIDARKNEIYWGVYGKKNDIMHEIKKDALNFPQDIEVSKVEAISENLQSSNIVVVGTGITYKNELLEKNKNIIIDSEILYPEAEGIIDIAKEKFLRGEIISPEEALPVYLRNEVADIPKNKN